MIATLLDATKSGVATSTVTTGSINSTGADFIAIAFSWVGTEPTISDSKGNTYTLGTDRTAGNGVHLKLAYAINPTVGTNHTFTFTIGASTYVGYAVSTWSGVLATSPSDQTAGTFTGPGVSSINIPDITPTEDRELVLAFVVNELFAGSTVTCGDDFSVVKEVDAVVSTSWGVGLYYKVQGSLAAVGPTISDVGGNRWSAGVHSFKTKTTGPTQFAFNTQPGNSTGGIALSTQPVIHAKDSGGTLDTSYTGPVTLSISTNPGGGTLSGTTTVNAVAGVATFTGISIDLIGTGYRLKATAPGMVDAASDAFNITLGAPYQIGNVTVPTNKNVAQTFNMTAYIQDAGGNTVTSSSATTTINLAVNPNIATLGGTTSVSAASGVVTFSGLSIDRACVGCTLRIGSAGLGSANTAAFDVLSGTEEASVDFDGFEEGLSRNTTTVNGWQFDEDIIPFETNSGTVEIVDTAYPTLDGEHVLAITCTEASDPVQASFYWEFNPLESAQGDNYLWEKAVDAGSYTLGTYNGLEFWIKTPEGINPPITNNTLGATDSGFTAGTYTKSALQPDGSQEAGGYHGYHAITIPYTNERWMRVKMLRLSVVRNNSGKPAFRCVRNTTNGTPFTSREVVTCSPSGASLRYGNEFNESGTNVIYLMFASSNDGFGGVNMPAAGDTLTGVTSGASRTISAATWPTFDGGFDMIGQWCNWDPYWINEGGATRDWALEAPGKTYWDRETRLYWAFNHQDNAIFPSTMYMDRIRFVEAADDDLTAIQNLGAFYDPSVSKLYVTFSKNNEMLNKTWEVTVGYQDLHANGLGTGTVWATQVDNGVANTLSFYESLTGTNERWIYIGVRPTDRATFAQIAIPTDDWEPGIPIPVASASGRRRFRRL